MLVQAIVAAALLASGARADTIPENPDLPSACRAGTVRTVDVDAQGRRFALRYAYREAEDPDMPVVIDIPGGPGQGSIGMPLSVPYEFGIVRTDPRGAGCNANAAISAEDVDSETIAKDVLAVVRDIGAKRYILYGASYGTMVATIAASKAREAGVPEPQAVVMEGVIGRAYKPEESLGDRVERWRELKRRLPPGAVRALSQDPPPFGFSPEVWGGWIEYLLLYGGSPGGGEGFAVTALSAVDPAAPESDHEMVRSMLETFSQPADAAHVNLYRAIVCRELDGANRGQKTDMILRGGELVPLAPGFCEGRPMDHPFDAAQYQISAPLFYFSGGEDPATPEFQTRYHYESQPAAPKTWVRVPSGSHLSLSGNLMDCQDSLWKDIAGSGGAHFPAILPTCGIKPAPNLNGGPP